MVALKFEQLLIASESHADRTRATLGLLELSDLYRHRGRNTILPTRRRLPGGQILRDDQMARPGVQVGATLVQELRRLCAVQALRPQKVVDNQGGKTSMFSVTTALWICDLLSPSQIKMCVPRVRRCSSDNQCKSGKRCVTLMGSKRSSCQFVPFECRRDRDCDAGRICRGDRRFKEIKRVCKDRVGRTPCKSNRDCPDSMTCWRAGAGRCIRKRPILCQGDRDCDKDAGEVCVYDPDGLHRTCRKPGCRRDSDCKEGKVCVNSRFTGLRCMDIGPTCKRDSDCEECEECVVSSSRRHATCVVMGQKCKRNRLDASISVMLDD